MDSVSLPQTANSASNKDEQFVAEHTVTQQAEVTSTSANKTDELQSTDMSIEEGDVTQSVSAPDSCVQPVNGVEPAGELCDSSVTVHDSDNSTQNKAEKIENVPQVESSANLNLSEHSEPSEPVNNCYCGKKRNFGIVELQCAGCYKWFHEECMGLSLGKCVPFMTYYTFVCKSCSPSGVESFSKKQPNFSQMCATALANLTHQATSEGKPRTMFSKDKEIIPYIEANWEYLTSMQRRVKQTWHATVYKAMLKDNDMFTCNDSKVDETPSHDPTFGLVNQDLMKIGPCYDAATKNVLQKQSQESAQNVSVFTSGKGRSAKRRFFGDGQIAAGGKKIKSDLVMPKLPPNGYPLEHPFNKDGYRYILAEPDPHAPFRQEFDESQDWAGKPIPGWLYRKLTPNSVLLALHDRAPQLKVSEDRLSVTGEKGYCMVRATHGVSRGTWYFEINIDDMSDGAASRLGWSQPLGNLQAPLGYDKFSYSWRSRKGTKFHESRGYHYTDEGYGHGDIIGFLIHLPATTMEGVPLPPIFKDKPLVKFKSYLYYEEKDEPQLELKALRPLQGSKIEFFKNGKSCGVAFENIYGGTYFPAASLYKNCTVSFNFGPDFKFPPPVPFKAFRSFLADLRQEKGEPFPGKWKTFLFPDEDRMHVAAHEAIIEQTMTDLLFFTENKGKLRLDNI